MRDLNELAKQVHAANAKWWQDINTGEPIERSEKELLALVVSEICECLEGERKNLMDDHLPNRKMAEVEMADTVIRLLDFAGGFGLRFPGSLDAVEKPWPGRSKGEELFDIISAVMFVYGAVVSNTGYWIEYSIRLCEIYCRTHGYDLWGAYDEKMLYNATRADHSHAARTAENGKKF